MMEEPEYLAELLYFYGSLYGPQLVLVATLSAITIYRREISCNHVYAEEEEEKVQENYDNASYRGDQRQLLFPFHQEQIELILNQAGLFCSGSSLAPLVWNLAKLFSLLSDNQMNSEGIQRKSVLGLKSTLSTGDLLDLAGSYYCGQPLATLLFGKRVHIPKSLPYFRQEIHPALLPGSLVGSESHDDLLGLPTDAWIHIMSFLNPKDVISFGSTNQVCRQFVDKGETANMLWKTLWKRDYAWILHHLPVGKRAAARSGRAEPRHGFNKHTYFRFYLSWLDFVLAGNNTVDECLVGIGGHIYDMSLFLLSHPGSPETVMVHAGQDATDFFHRIGHSRGARKLAQSMCIVVDTSRLRNTHGGVGLRPTTYTKFAEVGQDPHLPSAVKAPEERETNRQFVRQPRSSVLLKIIADFQLERRIYEAKALQLLSSSCNSSSALTQPKVFYDPLNQEWKAWYMRNDLVNVFMDDLQKG